MSSLRDLRGKSGLTLLASLIAGGTWRAGDLRTINLRQQCRRLARFFRRPGPHTTPLQPATLRLFSAVAEHSDLLTALHPAQWDATAALTRLAAYQNSWLRDPETWRPSADQSPAGQWCGLIRHLLTNWPLPAFFESAWLVWGPLEHLERDWYCHAGRGGSLRTAPGMPREITARALHLAMQCGPGTSLRQAVRLGQLQACGADPALVREVLTSRMVHDFSHENLWTILIRKAVADPSPAPGKFSLVADTLLETARRGELHRASVLARLPMEELWRFSRRWWTALADSVQRGGWLGDGEWDITRPGCRAELGSLTGCSWAPLPGITPEPPVPDSCGEALLWSFRELTTPMELVIEGQHLRHCVATWRRKCFTGSSAVFSVGYRSADRPDGPPLRHLTLEVDCGKRRIVQIRGRWNRSPSLWERELAAAWAARQKLTLAA